MIAARAKRHRDAGLDVARGLAMLLVLYGHALEPVFRVPGGAPNGAAALLWQTIYAFHMPLFFLIMGVTDGLAPRKPLAGVFAGAAEAIAVATLFGLLGAVPLVLLGDWTPEHALLTLAESRGYSLAPLWFLVALALARVIEAGAAALKSRVFAGLLIALVVLASYLCARRQVAYWQVHTLCGVLPFYVAGRRLGPAGLHVTARTAALGLCVLLMLGPYNPAHLADGRYGLVPVFFIAAVAGLCAALWLSRWLAAGPLAPGLAAIGRRSFDLFIVNGIALAVTPPLPGLGHSLAGLLGLALVAIPAQIALAACLHRPLTALRRSVAVRAREPSPLAP